MSEYVPEIEIILDTVAIDPDKRSISLPFIYREGDVILKDVNLFNTRNENEFEDIIVGDIKTNDFKSRLKNFDDVKNGDIIYSTWYDGEPVEMIVEGIEDGKNTALGKIHDGCYGSLYFDHDFRKCWTCGGYMFMNLSAVAKLDFEVV